MCKHGCAAQLWLTNCVCFQQREVGDTSELTESLQLAEPPQTFFPFSLVMMILCLAVGGWPFLVCTVPALLLSIKVHMQREVKTIEVIWEVMGYTTNCKVYAYQIPYYILPLHDMGLSLKCCSCKGSGASSHVKYASHAAQVLVVVFNLTNIHNSTLP